LDAPNCHDWRRIDFVRYCYAKLMVNEAVILIGAVKVRGMEIAEVLEIV
jgi:hypothetical protein